VLLLVVETDLSLRMHSDRLQPPAEVQATCPALLRHTVARTTQAAAMQRLGSCCKLIWRWRRPHHVYSGPADRRSRCRRQPSAGITLLQPADQKMKVCTRSSPRAVRPCSMGRQCRGIVAVCNLCLARFVPDNSTHETEA
jgi:hypothetical protein